MNERQKKAINNAPVTCQGFLERAFTGKASPREAIRAFCLHCLGYVRGDVAACSAYACPLHGYRPYRAGKPRREARGDEE